MNYKKIIKVVGAAAIAVVVCIGCSEEDEYANDGKGDDSYIYSGRIVKIDHQTWMARNLDRATINSKCYENSLDNCAKYGRLYTWSDAKKACPSGWHLPTSEEWSALITAVDHTSTKLKATSGWSEYAGNGTDDYGFSALPGGYGNGLGNFYDAGESGYWWIDIGHGASNAWIRDVFQIYEAIHLGGNLYSIRCVQD
jgi:uncharacterized protein (TIGR02145 family)